MPVGAASTKLPVISGMTVFVCLLAGISLQLLPPEISEPIVEESGPVENASALLYAIGLAVALLQLSRFRTLPWLSGTMMLLWLMLRELDFQKMFTYRSVESIGFYTRPIAPWWQKVLAIFIL